MKYKDNIFNIQTDKTLFCIHAYCLLVTNYVILGMKGKFSSGSVLYK